MRTGESSFCARRRHVANLFDWLARRGLLLLSAATLLGCRAAPARPTCDDSSSPSSPASARTLAVASSTSASPGSSDATPAPADDRSELAFAVHGKVVRSLPKAAVRGAIPIETITIADAYYDGRLKSWRALPLRKVLERGFEGEARELDAQHFLLRCVDGYTVPIDGKRLLEAYVAIADAEVPGWEPIGPKRAHPGPFFVVWKGKDEQNLESFPRPYQLATIEVASFEETFPHVVPNGEAPRASAWRGFSIFKEQCVRCHAMNHEGGRVGPELNVPKSIVEYRSDAQIRAFIRNPREYRYSVMPSHEHLAEGDLDGLLAYFRAMSRRKHDTLAAKGGAATSSGGAP
jgi:mono/diheme cytochrome c family protein